MNVAYEPMQIFALTTGDRRPCVFLGNGASHGEEQAPTDKKLWVAALDLNAAPGTDPSNPAFYLPGQELHAGNARGYWSVDVCHQDGLSCETGDECCGGYCERVDGGLVCSSYKPVCAALYDKCAQDSDCCAVSQNVHCINMVCAGSQPPK
jgi:hypothetical protein